MRKLTYPEFLFGASLVFLFCYLFSFNYELLGRSDVCSIDLLAGSEGMCQLSSEGTSKFRLVVKFGGNADTVTAKIPVSLHITSKNYSYSESNIIPKATSTGVGKRYYKTLNYGVYEIPEKERIEIRLKAGEGVEKLKLFNAKIVTNPSNILIYTFAFLFLFTLLLSIITRKRTFLQKYGRPVPYVLYVFVSILTLTWNI